jgi:hypothetical protein
MNDTVTDTMNKVSDQADTFSTDAYNAVPNFDSLIANFQSDANDLEGWDRVLSDLNLKINSSDSIVANETGGWQTYARARVDNLKGYAANMSEMKDNLMTFCDDMVGYLNSVENGTIDDSLEARAIAAYDRAAVDAEAVDVCSSAVNDNIKKFNAG